MKTPAGEDYEAVNRAREQEFKAECTAAGRECLTPREAAKLFGVGESTIREAARRGVIAPFFKLTLANGHAALLA